MRRKNDKHEPELEGIAQRLRSERPEASPLELDQIKTTAMSRAQAATGRANPRRLVVAALTVGLMAAGTGGVLAAGGSGSPAGNAANAQYSSTNSCGSGNGNGNGSHNGVSGEGNVGENGNESGNGNGNFDCNTNSFNNNGNGSNNTTTNNTYNVNNNTSSTITITGTQSASGGVAGTSSKKVTTSSRRLKIHVNLPRKGKLRRVSVSVNGKHLKTITGRKASANVVLTDLPCGTGATTVTITVTLASGKTVTESHTYHLCS
jgi:hypothetical protein